MLSLAELGLRAPVPNPTDDGNFGVEMFVCAATEDLDGAVAPGVYGSFFTGVEPPEDLAQDVTFHFVKWDVVIAPPLLRQALVDAGLPAIPGEAAFDQFEETGPSILASGSMLMDATWTNTFEATGTLPDPSLMSGNFVEFTAVPTGLAAWYADFTFDALAEGAVTVQVSAGSIGAEVLGTDPVQGAAYVGVINFDGNVTLPR